MLCEAGLDQVVGYRTGARRARAAARAARAAFARRGVLLVAHTRARAPPRHELVDLRQNFLMYVTPATPLADVRAPRGTETRAPTPGHGL